VWILGSDRESIAELRAGWQLIVAAMAGILFGVTALFFYSVGIFLKPVSQEFGWSRTLASTVGLVAAISLAITAPLVGSLVDRFGIRAVALSSGIGLSAGFMALSHTPPVLPAYLTLIALCVSLGAGASPIVYTRLINEHFANARGTALGLSQIATGIAGALVPAMLAPFVASHGWRTGYEVMAAIVLASTPVVLVLIGRHGRPNRGAIAPARSGSGMRVRDVLRDREFYRLAAVVILAAIGVGGLIVHLVPMLTDAGLTPAEAGRTAGMLGIAIIFARISAGVLIDRIFAPFVAFGVFLTAGVGCLMLARGGVGFAPYATLFVGLAIGAEIDLISYFVVRYFGMKNYGKIYGWLYAFFMAGTALGPVLAGFSYDHYGNYSVGVGILGGCLVGAGILSLTLGPFRTFDSARSVNPPPPPGCHAAGGS
jgi:MFS family permease